MKGVKSANTILAGTVMFLAFLLPAAEKTGTVKESKVNVRGQPALIGEVVTQLKQGEPVTILEEITPKQPKTGEPSRWYKIAMPANTPLWVHKEFVEADNTVKSRKLNVRSGPGENFSVVGVMEKGAPVKVIRTVNDWIEIETPPGAYAFVASDLIATQSTNLVAAVEPPKLVQPLETITPTTTPPATKPDETVVVAAPPVVIEPPAAPVKTEPAPPAVATTPVENTSPASATTTEAAPKRVVTREGIVRRALSIQSPSYFALENKETGATVNYLHSQNPDIQLKLYLGFKVIVTGEELVDSRWKSVPLIEVEKLDLP